MRERTSAGQASAVLEAVFRHPRHRAWPADIPAIDVRSGMVQGHRQVADACLAAIAHARGGRRLTLDYGLAAAHPEVAEPVKVVAP